MGQNRLLYCLVLGYSRSVATIEFIYCMNKFIRRRVIVYYYLGEPGPPAVVGTVLVAADRQVELVAPVHRHGTVTSEPRQRFLQQQKKKRKHQDILRLDCHNSVRLG